MPCWQIVVVRRKVTTQNAQKEFRSEKKKNPNGKLIKIVRTFFFVAVVVLKFFLLLV